MTPDYFSVETADGPLGVRRWGSGEHVVVAAHGITANSASFAAVADQLDGECTLLAPDLRGRGTSRGIAGPYGMRAHANDVVSVLDHLGVDRATLVGHSMGGFVAVVFAHLHPDRTQGIVLVDGGLPLDLGPLAALPIEDVVRTIIGPSLDRLRMTFASVDDYFAYWRPHPALADDWNDYVEEYLRHDLVGAAPALRSSVREKAVLDDAQSELRDPVVEEALAALDCPALLLRAPRGVMNGDPLYSDATVQKWCGSVPGLRVETVPDVNHFTITLSERGAKAVAAAVSREVARD